MLRTINFSYSERQRQRRDRDRQTQISRSALEAQIFSALSLISSDHQSPCSFIKCCLPLVIFLFSNRNIPFFFPQSLGESSHIPVAQETSIWKSFISTPSKAKQVQKPRSQNGGIGGVLNLFIFLRLSKEYSLKLDRRPIFHFASVFIPLPSVIFDSFSAEKGGVERIGVKGLSFNHKFKRPAGFIAPGRYIPLIALASCCK